MEYLSDFDKLDFNEEEDIKRLEEIESIDFSQSEYVYDRITQLVKDLFNVPIVLISIVKKKIQWFASCVGLPVK